MTFVRRYLDVTFSNRQSGQNITFNQRGKYALRTSARILKAGGFTNGEMALQIWGLSLDHINELSTYGTYANPNYNYQITVDAGDEINGMSTVFVGGIQQAWGDMRAMPNVPFHVLAKAGGAPAVNRQQPTTYPGSTDVPMMLQKLAQAAGLNFENSGVSAKLADPYFWGSGWKQMKEIIDAAGIDGIIDDNTLAIWPRNGARNGDTIEVSADTGMRDYPSFTTYGVQVRVEFRRALRYGQYMNIKSDIPKANGRWRIMRIDYDLQANTPKGGWYAILDGMQDGAPITDLSKR